MEKEKEKLLRLFSVAWNLGNMADKSDKSKAEKLKADAEHFMKYNVGEFLDNSK